MKLAEMFKRQNPADDAFRSLEDSLNEMITVELTPPLEPSDHDQGFEVEAKDDTIDVQAQTPDEPNTTAYTVARIAEYTAFEAILRSTQADSELAASLLTKIKVAQRHTREYLNSAYSSIHRANELEISVSKLAEENRVLRRQSDQVHRIRGQFESVAEAFRKREAKLVEAADALRQALSAAKLEAVELQGRVNALVVERQETMNALAATNLQLEGVSSENEMLREKQVNLVADLDQASRKRAEAERKADEFASLHARDTAEISELHSKLSVSEAERQRLQKQVDSVGAALVETKEALGVLEVETSEQAKRHEAVVNAIKAERDSLLTRLATRSETGIDEHSPEAVAIALANARRRPKLMA